MHIVSRKGEKKFHRSYRLPGTGMHNFCLLSQQDKKCCEQSGMSMPSSLNTAGMRKSSTASLPREPSFLISPLWGIIRRVIRTSELLLCTENRKAEKRIVCRVRDNFLFSNVFSKKKQNFFEFKNSKKFRIKNRFCFQKQI